MSYSNGRRYTRNGYYTARDGYSDIGNLIRKYSNGYAVFTVNGDTIVIATKNALLKSIKDAYSVKNGVKVLRIKKPRDESNVLEEAV